VSSAEFLLNPNTYDRVMERTLERVEATTRALIQAFQDDTGRVAGQVPLERDDRVLWTLDFIESGAMDILRGLNRDVHDGLMRDYLKDLAAFGFTMDAPPQAIVERLSI